MTEKYDITDYLKDDKELQKAVIKKFLKENAVLKHALELRNGTIQKFKAENERLKQEWRLDCLKCEYKNTKADVDKYRKTLQEIKAITENSCRMTDKDLCDNNSCAVCKSISDSDAIEQISQKITKAESEG